MTDQKNKVIQISYRPSEEVQNLFNRFCGESDSILNKTQLIEIAFEFMTLLADKEIDWVVSNMVVRNKGEILERFKRKS